MKQFIKKIFLLPIFLFSCGSKINYLKNYAPQNLLEQAELDMEAGSQNAQKYIDAQLKLETLLHTENNNYNARSLLSASYAAQADIIMLNIIKQLIISTTTSNNQLEFINSLIPETTTNRLDKMKLAIYHINLIPIANMTIDIKTQSGIFYTCYIAMIIEKIKNDTKNNFQTENDSTLLLNSLSNAIIILNNDNLGISKVLNEISNNINNSKGNNNNDKVKNYIINTT